MEEHVEMIRRLMLAINRVDGAYYYFSKKDGDEGKYPYAFVCAG